MNKAFVKENDDDDDELLPEQQLPKSSKNYLTPQGWQRLQQALSGNPAFNGVLVQSLEDFEETRP